MLPIGQYAVKIIFNDGHRSGLYDWDYLYKLGSNKEALWQDYLQRCRDAEAADLSKPL